MDTGKILLVNLSRGKTGDLNSKLLGMIFVMKFEAAAMSRADIPEEYRQDFCLYVDEFQNFSTDSFADILSQARKYHLNLIVANQFTTQLSDEIRDAVFGNVGTVVSFRVGTADAEFLEKQFRPIFDIDDLQFLPNANTVVRMMISGVPVQPFSMATLPPLGSPNMQLMEALKQLSAAKYGKPKAAVEAEIFKRLTTEQPQKLAPAANNDLLAKYGLGPSGGSSKPQLPPVNAGQLPKPASPAGGGSFLDEWLSKRKTAPPNPVAASTAPSPNVPPAAASTGPVMAPAASTASSTPVPAQAAQDQPAPLVKKPGELKINHETSGADGEGVDADQVHTVRIDRDGNLTYDK
jgi:hypothetical protein